MEELKTVNIEMSNTYKEHFLYVLNNDLEEMVKNIRGTTAEIEKLEERILTDESALNALKRQLKHAKEELATTKANAKNTRDLIDATAPGSHHWNDFVKSL